MKLFGRLSSLLNIAIVAVLCGMAVFGFARWYYVKDGQFDQPVVFEVPQGAGVITISQSLEDQGIIPSAHFFRGMVAVQGRAGALKFGEYEIPAHASMHDVLDILVEGKAIQLAVTFPEGWTSWQMIERLNAVSELEGEIETLPAEGALAPNTYAYLRGSNRAEILQQMEAAQAKILDDAWENRADDLPLKSKEELLILASIVEKETATPEERGMVASVFVNRLRKNMKLQTDPTVIYGITLGQKLLDRPIRRSELDKETAYNTYIIDGLPPTPICNPGAESIRAVANPPETDYYYFVAKTANPADGHNFSKNLDEHNKNVQIYREAQQSAN